MIVKITNFLFIGRPNHVIVKITIPSGPVVFPSCQNESLNYHQRLENGDLNEKHRDLNYHQRENGALMKGIDASSTLLVILVDYYASAISNQTSAQ